MTFNFYIELEEDGQYKVSRGSVGYPAKKDTFVGEDPDAVAKYIERMSGLPGQGMASSLFDLVVDAAALEKLGGERVTAIKDQLDLRTQQIAGVDAAVNDFGDGLCSLDVVLDTARKNKYP